MVYDWFGNFSIIFITFILFLPNIYHKNVIINIILTRLIVLHCVVLKHTLFSTEIMFKLP